MVSVSMIAFTILAIIEANKNPSFSVKAFISDKSFSALLVVFFAVFLSIVNSEDQNQWVHQIKMKLPFVFLPFSFYVFKPWIDQKFHKWIHLAFIATIFVSTFQVIGNFLLDKESITSSIGKGKSIPTPIDHIHYSIMLAYAVVSSALFAIFSSNKKEKWGIFALSAYLFAFMHFLSVRTGLALSYAGIGVILLWYVFSFKKYVLGLGIAALLVTIPFIAFKTIEPFKRKINYMFWDLAQFQQGNGKSYSDSERLMSYEISFDLIKESPVIGHGIGDLKHIMIAKHKEKYGQKEKYIYPHNQYLYILTCMGILGALLFFYGLLSPIIYTSNRNIFLISIFVLMLISFLVENTIQRAVITGFFVFFIVLNLSLKPENKNIS